MEDGKALIKVQKLTCHLGLYDMCTDEGTISNYLSIYNLKECFDIPFENVSLDDESFSTWQSKKTDVQLSESHHLQAMRFLSNNQNLAVCKICEIQFQHDKKKIHTDQLSIVNNYLESFPGKSTTITENDHVCNLCYSSV